MTDETDDEQSDDGIGPVPVEIVGLRIIPSEGLSIVLLGQSDRADRVLPILIGPAEAQSIGFASKASRCRARSPTISSSR